RRFHHCWNAYPRVGITVDCLAGHCRCAGSWSSTSARRLTEYRRSTHTFPIHYGLRSLVNPGSAVAAACESGVGKSVVNSLMSSLVVQSKTKRAIWIILKSVVALLLIAAVAGFVYEEVGRRQDCQRLPQIGRSVDIGGRT